jgi:hypothetical protein
MHEILPQWPCGAVAAPRRPAQRPCCKRGATPQSNGGTAPTRRLRSSGGPSRSTPGRTHVAQHSPSAPPPPRPQAIKVGDSLKDSPEFYRVMKAHDGSIASLAMWVLLFLCPRRPVAPPPGAGRGAGGAPREGGGWPPHRLRRARAARQQGRTRRCGVRRTAPQPSAEAEGSLGRLSPAIHPPPSPAPAHASAASLTARASSCAPLPASTNTPPSAPARAGARAELRSAPGAPRQTEHTQPPAPPARRPCTPPRPPQVCERAQAAARPVLLPRRWHPRLHQGGAQGALGPSGAHRGPLEREAGRRPAGPAAHPACARRLARRRAAARRRAPHPAETAQPALSLGPCSRFPLPRPAPAPCSLHLCLPALSRPANSGTSTRSSQRRAPLCLALVATRPRRTRSSLRRSGCRSCFSPTPPPSCARCARRAQGGTCLGAPVGAPVG